MISNRDKIIFDWVTYRLLAESPHTLSERYSYEDAHRDSSTYPPCDENFVIAESVLQSKLIKELLK